MVVTGLNTRSRYWTPCSLRTSRILASVKMSDEREPLIAQSDRAPHPGLTWNHLQIDSDSSRLIRMRYRRVPCPDKRPGVLPCSRSK